VKRQLNSIVDVHNVRSDRDVELAQAFPIGDDAQFGDLAVPEGERHRHHQPAARRHDDAHV
jgi:hypothetical protein